MTITWLECGGIGGRGIRLSDPALYCLQTLEQDTTWGGLCLGSILSIPLTGTLEQSLLWLFQRIQPRLVQPWPCTSWGVWGLG